MMFTATGMASIVSGRWLDAPPATGPSQFAHDTRVSMDGAMYVAIQGEHHDGHDFLEDAATAGAVMALVDRDVESSIPRLLVPDTRVALGALAAAWRQGLDGTRVIAITGTAGKTTTKDLLSHVLGSRLKGSASPASWNNAIGAPMSVLRARADDDYLILELGTSSPGEISYLSRISRPDLAIVTLVGHGHLAGLGSIDGVRTEKLSLLDWIMPGGTALVYDDGQDVTVSAGIELLRHGDGPRSTLKLADRGRDHLQLEDGTTFPCPLPGRHHAMNTIPVIATARRLGLTDDEITQALAAATPSAGRGDESIIAGIRFIDDAYNANPDSVAAALAAWPEQEATGRRIIILGDMLELGDESESLHAALGPLLMDSHDQAPIDEVLLVGEAISSLKTQVDSRLATHHWPVADASSMAEIADRLISGDLVLLKASRGLKLERVIDCVRKRESEAATA